ncbi:MAG: SDR family oxidoreductase, partial [Steroidobacteraceae bacterium]
GQYRAKVVLTGRSELDARKREALGERAGCAGEVLYVPADVCNLEQMRSVRAAAERRFGRIDGVIHAAGVQALGSVLELDGGRLQAVFAPKIGGTLTLERLFEDDHPDFICYFSSSSAVLGDFGACAYAVANRFQSAHAQYCGSDEQEFADGNGNRCRRLAIQWPLWEEGGMGFRNDAGARLYLTSSGQCALTGAQGIAAFERLLRESDRRPTAQPVVLSGRLDRLARLVGLESGTTPMPLASETASRERALECIQSRLKEELSKILGIRISDIDSAAGLSQYGFDSLSLGAYAEALSGWLAVDLRPTIFFEFSTIAALAIHLLTAYPQAAARAGAPLGTTSSAAPVPPPAEAIAPATRDAAIPAATDTLTEAVAIIGMSGRFPGARDVEQLWARLREGADCVTEIPADRWNCGDCLDPTAPGGGLCRWGGFLEEVDAFDPLFFGISPHDAGQMDPQTLLFLEEAWHLLEDSGYTRERLARHHRSRGGVYVGSMYTQRPRESAGASETVNPHVSRSAIANRVSHYFGLKGPSIAVDTMCSSAAVAIHLACRDLLLGECEIAIAGGVNLSLHPGKYLGLNRARVLGSSADSRSFSAGDGYLPAECVGAVLLKRLTRARADDDEVLALIRSSAVGHSGGANGYSQPDPNSQAELI